MDLASNLFLLSFILGYTVFLILLLRWMARGWWLRARAQTITASRPDRSGLNRQSGRQSGQ